MKFLGFDKVLCLAPHPDDIEYSMGGTIIKYQNTHFDILCLTQGGDYDITTNKERIEEVIESWNTIKNPNYDLYFSRVLNGNKSYVKSITPPEGTVSVSSVSATLKTGWIPITNNYGRDSIVRRINMRYRSDTSEITVSLYINEDSETKVWEGSLKTFGNMQSLRVGRRAKNIQLVINIKPITPYDLIPSELRRIEIETD